LEWVAAFTQQFPDQEATGPGPIKSAGSSSAGGRSIDELFQLAALPTATPFEVLGLSYFGGLCFTPCSPFGGPPGLGLGAVIFSRRLRFRIRADCPLEQDKIDLDEIR